MGSETKKLLINAGLDKGYFINEAALLTAYPNTIVDPTVRNGWSAILGSTDTKWIWDADTNVWVNSTLQGTVSSIDGKTGVVDGRFSNAIFFGKGGSGSNDGKSYIQRKETLAEAKAAASALTPAADNQIAIRCDDAATYAESYTNVAFVHLIALAAKITGNVVVAEDCIIELGICDGDFTVNSGKTMAGHIRFITGSVTKTGTINGIVGDSIYITNIVTA